MYVEVVFWPKIVQIIVFIRDNVIFAINCWRKSYFPVEMKLEKNYFNEQNTNILLNLTDNPTHSKGKNRNYEEFKFWYHNWRY